MNIEELQNKIEKSYPEPIRLEKTKRFTDKVKQTREQTLHEFLVIFFTEWNGEKNTIWAKSKQIQTKTSGNHGNTVGCRRSLGDIYMLCKYYYPTCTLEDVVRELFIILPQTFNKGFRSSYCYAMSKRVWYFAPESSNTYVEKTKHDEWGNPHRYYLSIIQGEDPDEEPDEEDEDAEFCEDCGEDIDQCECD